MHINTCQDMHLCKQIPKYNYANTDITYTYIIMYAYATGKIKNLT